MIGDKDILLQAGVAGAAVATPGRRRISKRIQGLFLRLCLPVRKLGCYSQKAVFRLLLRHLRSIHGLPKVLRRVNIAQHISDSISRFCVPGRNPSFVYLRSRIVYYKSLNTIQDLKRHCLFCFRLCGLLPEDCLDSAEMSPQQSYEHRLGPIFCRVSKIGSCNRLLCCDMVSLLRRSYAHSNDYCNLLFSSVT